MKRYCILIFIILLSVSLNYSVTKKLTFEQVVGMGGERLFKPLPRIMGWADSKNYFEFEFKTGILYKVNAKSGNRKPAMDPKKFRKYTQKGYRFFPPEDRTKNFSKFFNKKKIKIFIFIIKKKIK